MPNFSETGLQHNPTPPDIKDAPECPEWLIEELSRNHVFVQEAIANWSGNEIAIAWITKKPAFTEAAIKTAVDAWIVHWWQYGNYDADHVARTWQKEIKF